MLARKGEAAEASKASAFSRNASNGLRVGERGSAFEREADRVADEVMASEKPRINWSLSKISMGSSLRRKCACGGSSECAECADKKTVQRKGEGTIVGSKAPPIVHEVLSSSGRPLDHATRNFFEPRFGHDFGNVRVHADTRAAESARAVGALAYTVGDHIAFGPGRYSPQTPAGEHLLSHELVHVVQQAPSVVDSPTLQRYEAGEHAQFGETGEIIKQMVSDLAFTYKVKPGEMPKQIAARFGVTEDELRSANSSKLKHWTAVSNPEKKVEGFNVGDEVIIPPVLNAATKEALKVKELTLTVNGVPLQYGEGISMADLFESPEQMMAASPAELRNLSKLIQKDKAGTPVSDQEWHDAIGDRYLDLAKKNETHFAPSNPALASVSGKSTGNNKTEWEKNHRKALETSQAGDKNKALATNAFADHFLTDAFAAGHLINKRDVMQMFEGNLPKNAKGDGFPPASKAFFDQVAEKSFSGDVKTEFSKLQTVACFNWKKEERPCSDSLTMHAVIDRVTRFSTLLQNIHSKEPEVFENVVVKGVHAKLNEQGVPVENEKGDKWDLSGDKTLNANPKDQDHMSLKIGRKAVAQSQMNVLDVFKLTSPLDLPGLFKKVWDFVPRPRAAGITQIKAEVEAGTDPRSSGVINTAVNEIKAHLKEIIKKLTERNYLEIPAKASEAPLGTGPRKRSQTSDGSQNRRERD